MHGLNTIHSINETAARQEFDAKLKALLSSGKVVVYKQDDLGRCDINTTPLGFYTVALAQQALLGKGGKWQIHK
jgi:hypothetical protein